MKIITCFIPQSEGKVSVCGFDVEADAMEVKKRVGYLPEHNPLYSDMFVKEYLTFIAGLHGLKNKKERVDEMVQLVGLEREQHKIIGALSKGYRQRVGLAQALIHDPEVLILDEPTTGLHFEDIRVLLNVLNKIVDKGNTVVIIEHNLDVIKTVDYIIDIGPEGGKNGGKVLAKGSPEEIIKIKKSHTARFLKKELH